MAKLSDLVLRTSEVTGIPGATVREISRRLREGRLIRTGKGGRYGGADMTPNDAATLLTALLVLKAWSVTLSKIVPLTTSHLRDLRAYAPLDRGMILAHWGRTLKLPELGQLKPGHTFEEALSSLISSVAKGDMEQATRKWGRFEIEVAVIGQEPELSARICFDTSTLGQILLFYIRSRDARGLTVPDKARRWSDVLAATADLRVSASIYDPTLKSIGILLRNSKAKHA